MVTNDATILRIKHEILYEVAKLAWNDQLEDGRDDIPYKISPGPQAQYRCCVYKEREIVRQRIRLAEGKCPSDRNTNNVVQVINAACEECPIASYTVTDNCRKCMGKACQNSCPFGAISMGNTKAHIDPDKCRECGKCSQACPYNAIAHLERPCKKVCPVDAITYDEYGVCVIDEKKCIQCGACIHSCPFGAIGSKTFMVDVIRLINAGKKVVAMLAPATEGQFGPDITFASWKTALKKIGFADMIEVGLGGDMTAAAEAEEWAEAYKEGKKMTTSCCPAFVNMIKQHFPQLLDNMSTTVSPMCAVSRMLKAQDPEVVTVFIGPCIAGAPNDYPELDQPWQDYLIHRAKMKNHPYTFDTYDQMAKYFGQYNFGVADGMFNPPYLDALFTNHSDMSINYMITHGWRKSPASQTLVDAREVLRKLGYLDNN